jgi:hypothetical protein
MRIEQRLLKRVGPSPRTVARRKEPVLSHLVSKVAVALAEIEAIQEVRHHRTSKSRHIMTMFPAE